MKRQDFMVTLSRKILEVMLSSEQQTDKLSLPFQAKHEHYTPFFQVMTILISCENSKWFPYFLPNR